MQPQASARPKAPPPAPPPLHGLPPPSRHLLVAVSAGLDSTALLHALLAAGHRRLTLLHLDHGIRGPASAGDARFVSALARRLRLPIIAARADVPALARSHKLSIETAARLARYTFFASAARATRCHTVVLAHHADDQAETFLFNLLRGGATGLGSMRPRSTRTVDGVPLLVLRPWLSVWRSEIEAYAMREKIRHRTDASNASLLHTRNRIRGHLLPMLSRHFGRDVRLSLWRAATVLAAQQQWIAQSIPPISDSLPIPTLRALPEALQRATLHSWLRHHRVPQISFSLIESLRALISPDATSARLNLPGSRFARRRAGLLFISTN